MLKYEIKKAEPNILCDRCKKICNTYGSKGTVSLVTKKGKKIHFCSDRCKEIFFGGTK